MIVISQEIVNKIGNQTSDSEGVSCKFIKVNNDWALKMYKTEKKRDHAYKMQSHFASLHIGPKTGDLIDFPEGDLPECRTRGGFLLQPYRFGYVTQVVRTLTEFNGTNYSEMLAKYGHGSCSVYYDTILHNRVVHLERISNCYLGDMHPNNWGWLYNELVPIDYDLIHPITH